MAAEKNSNRPPSRPATSSVARSARAAGQCERPATERTLQVLAHVAAAGRPQAVGQIAAGLSLPKATTSRICERLRLAGYLVHEPGGRLLGVGPRLFRLGLDIVRQSGTNSARHAVLAEVVADIGETCNLTTLAGSEVLYLDRVETRWPLRLALEPGSRVPLHCTASGKLFLALMPPPELERMLDTLQLDEKTTRTLTTRPRLLRELKRTAARGYSVDNEEFIYGLVAVAVPVRDGTGRPIAALACHAPVARLDQHAAIALVPRLRRAAARIAAVS